MKLPKHLHESIAAWLADKEDPALLKADGYNPIEIWAHLLKQAEKIMTEIEELHQKEVQA